MGILINSLPVKDVYGCLYVCRMHFCLDLAITNKTRDKQM